MSREFYRAAAIMGIASFFTLINLFAPQAAVFALGNSFDVSPWTMGIALNAAVVGMAMAGPIGAMVADRFNRKSFLVLTLALLAVPTAMIDLSTNLLQFTLLRVMQGVLMAGNFAVSIAYIAEEWGPLGSAPLVMAAYVTGNIAGQVLGRVGMGIAVETIGWHSGFLVLSAVTACGAGIMWRLLPAPATAPVRRVGAGLVALRIHLGDTRMVAAFAVGFTILFAFVGVFTYVNYHLVRAFYLSSSQVGLLYMVFVLALFSTPAAGVFVRRFGHRPALLLGGVISIIGTILTLSPALPIVLCGLALAASGTFFCQAVATSFVGHAATNFKAAGSGLYLSAYYIGGLVGAAMVGCAFDWWDWPGCVALLSIALVTMSVIAARFWTPTATR